MLRIFNLKVIFSRSSLFSGNIGFDNIILIKLFCIFLGFLVTSSCASKPKKNNEIFNVSKKEKISNSAKNLDLSHKTSESKYVGNNAQKLNPPTSSTTKKNVNVRSNTNKSQSADIKVINTSGLIDPSKNMPNVNQNRSSVNLSKNVNQNFFRPADKVKTADDLIITNEKLFNGSKSQNEKIEEIKLLSELRGNKIHAKSAKELYEMMIKAYSESKYDLVKLCVKDFEVRFSKHHLLDNAWYLMALASSEQNEYNLALNYFKKIETYSASGDRIAQAKFAKSRMYKKMGLVEVSVDGMNDVVKSYSGSPESYQALNELKIMKKKNQIKR